MTLLPPFTTDPATASAKASAASPKDLARRRFLQGATAAGTMGVLAGPGSLFLPAPGWAAGAGVAEFVKELILTNLRNAGLGRFNYATGAPVAEFRALKKPEIVSGAPARPWSTFSRICSERGSWQRTATGMAAWRVT